MTSWSIPQNLPLHCTILDSTARLWWASYDLWIVLYCVNGVEQHMRWVVFRCIQHTPLCAIMTCLWWYRIDRTMCHIPHVQARSIAGHVWLLCIIVGCRCMKGGSEQMMSLWTMMRFERDSYWLPRGVPKYSSQFELSCFIWQENISQWYRPENISQWYWPCTWGVCVQNRHLSEVSLC